MIVVDVSPQALADIGVVVLFQLGFLSGVALSGPPGDVVEPCSLEGQVVVGDLDAVDLLPGDVVDAVEDLVLGLVGDIGVSPVLLNVALIVSHLEDHLHVVGGAASAHPPVQILPGRRGNEVVVLSRPELQTARGGGERPEGDGEVAEAVGRVTDGHDLGLGVGDATRVKLLAADAVDNVGLRELGARLGHRADDVDLVVLPGQVAGVDVHNVVGVVQPEHGVVLVPVDVVQLLGTGEGHGKSCHQQCD